MKRNLLWMGLLVTLVGQAQTKPKKIYTTHSGEWIFSFANVQDNTSEQGSILRFAPVLNAQNWLHVDVDSAFGFFTGLSCRNVGFIYQVPGDYVKKKYRSYNLGIPVGVKMRLGKRSFLFAGYELEFPFHYKEKTFEYGRKTDRIQIWFSNRTPDLSHSLMAGIQLRHGATLKFKYYLTPFFDPNYTAQDAQGNVVHPYEHFNANVFYCSLSFRLLRITRLKRKLSDQNDMKQAYVPTAF